jgi:hypothetical protein
LRSQWRFNIKPAAMCDPIVKLFWTPADALNATYFPALNIQFHSLQNLVFLLQTLQHKTLQTKIKIHAKKSTGHATQTIAHHFVIVGFNLKLHLPSPTK